MTSEFFEFLMRYVEFVRALPNTTAREIRNRDRQGCPVARIMLYHNWIRRRSRTSKPFSGHSPNVRRNAVKFVSLAQRSPKDLRRNEVRGFRDDHDSLEESRLFRPISQNAISKPRQPFKPRSETRFDSSSPTISLLAAAPRSLLPYSSAIAVCHSFIVSRSLPPTESRCAATESLIYLIYSLARRSYPFIPFEILHTHGLL